MKFLQQSVSDVSRFVYENHTPKQEPTTEGAAKEEKLADLVKKALENPDETDIQAIIDTEVAQWEAKAKELGVDARGVLINYLEQNEPLDAKEVQGLTEQLEKDHHSEEYKEALEKGLEPYFEDGVSAPEFLYESLLDQMSMDQLNDVPGTMKALADRFGGKLDAKSLAQIKSHSGRLEDFINNTEATAFGEPEMEDKPDTDEETAEKLKDVEDDTERGKIMAEKMKGLKGEKELFNWVRENPEMAFDFFFENLGENKFKARFDRVDELGFSVSETLLGLGHFDYFVNRFAYSSINGRAGARQARSPKPGYFDATGYIAIYSGDTIEGLTEKPEGLALGNTSSMKDYRDQAKTHNDQYANYIEMERGLLNVSGGAVDITSLPEETQALAKKMQEMSPRQVFDMRKQMGAKGFKQFMRTKGLLNAKLSKGEVEGYAASAIEKDGDIFPGRSKADQIKLLTSLLKHESDWRPFNVSPTGALGIGQMIKANYVNKWNFNPLNPEIAIRYAAEHLRLDRRSLGSDEYAITAYNRGAGYVRRHGTGGPSKEGRNYLPKVMAEYQRMN